jgi:cytochrome c-type biogenesis protein CcmH
MARGMVERLAARLEANPRDADGWIRLMRSYMVMNEPDRASQARRTWPSPPSQGDVACTGSPAERRRRTGCPRG